MTHGIQTYNAIALLNRIFNNAFGIIAIPFMAFTLCSLFVLSVCTATRLHQSMDLVSLTWFPLIIVFFSLLIGLATPILTKDHELSTQFERNSLRALGTFHQMRQNHDWYQRLFKSRKNLRIEFLGNTYYVKRKTKIIVFRELMNWTIDLLLTW